MPPVSNSNAYVKRLSRLTNEELAAEATEQIRTASFDKNDPWASAHWKIDFIHDECTERGGTLFQDAYRVAAAGHKRP